MTNHRPDVPYRRVYGNGKEVWQARYTNPVTGKREYARPDWNRRRAVFALKRDAQRAITEAIAEALKPQVRSDGVGVYASTWLDRHPRAERTNAGYRIKINTLLGVKVEDKPLREYLLTEVRRRHVNHLVDHLLREGRALRGVRGILTTYSAMFGDAIEDELCEVNPFLSVKLRKSDPRIRKQPRECRVWGFEAMHEFARLAGRHEAMVRVLCDCGLRVGEAVALKRADFDAAAGTLRVRGTAHAGRITGDTDTKMHARVVPVPPSTTALLVNLPKRIDSDLLFPTATGRLWRERNFYRDIWTPTQEKSGWDIRPHEMRHSYITHLAAEGVYDADLAEIAGHSPATMIGVYRHPVNRSHDQVRGVIG